MDAILAHCEKNGRRLWEVVEEFEGAAVRDYLARGLGGHAPGRQARPDGRGSPAGRPQAPPQGPVLQPQGQGVSPGPSASAAPGCSPTRWPSPRRTPRGGLIVTAPTCGSAGVVPGRAHSSRQATASSPRRTSSGPSRRPGSSGAMAKANASISGAEVGCQGEIGVACAMAGAAAAQSLGRHVQPRSSTRPRWASSTTSA